MRKTKDGKIILTYKEAVKRLPPKGDIHTFAQTGSCLIGADWARSALLREMKRAIQIEETGQAAQAMGHGIAIWRSKTDALFIETRKHAQ